MDNAELNRCLRNKAIALGLCENWQGQWNNDWDEGKMIAKYKEGIDFCLANRYPSNDFIKRNFSLKSLRKGGLFVDDKYSINDMRTVVALGSSNLRIRYNGNSIGEVYMTDDSIINLTARDDCHIIVHILGNAKISASQYGKASLLIIKHSTPCTVVTEGNVRIKEELDWLK